MFGYFKMDADCPTAIGEHYKKFYCFLCRSLEKYYGQLSRCLLSYDVALLLLLFTEEGFLSQVPKIGCLRKTPELKQSLTEEVSRKIATLHVLLVAAKLDDDIRDEGSFAAKAAQLAASGQISKAKKTEPEMWEIIRDEYIALRELEKQNAPLDALEQQFSRMMVLVGARCFGLQDPQRLKALDFAARWLYFIDAVDDLDENLAEKTFNPLASFGSFRDMKRLHYRELAAHFQQLHSQATRLAGADNAQVLNYILFTKVPTETIHVLLKVRE